MKWMVQDIEIFHRYHAILTSYDVYYNVQEEQHFTYFFTNYINKYFIVIYILFKFNDEIIFIQHNTVTDP